MPSPVSSSSSARSAAVALAAALALAPVHGKAQDSKSLATVRDAETEQLLREYAAPILKAAGINAAGAKIVLVNNRAFNAFVASGQKIFINVGALMDAQTPNEVIGMR
jgi:predicted Zn-dependent protease